MPIPTTTPCPTLCIDLRNDAESISTSEWMMCLDYWVYFHRYYKFHENLWASIITTWADLSFVLLMSISVYDRQEYLDPIDKSISTPKYELRCSISTSIHTRMRLYLTRFYPHVTICSILGSQMNRRTSTPTSSSALYWEAKRTVELYFDSLCSISAALSDIL